MADKQLFALEKKYAYLYERVFPIGIGPIGIYRRQGFIDEMFRRELSNKLDTYGKPWPWLLSTGGNKEDYQSFFSDYDDDDDDYEEDDYD